MIEKIHIENYKSISSLDLELGRVTVLIGENGSGKSNILEAIAFAAAASQHKLDNEFLTSRGVRTSLPCFMKSAFSYQQKRNNIYLTLVNRDKQTLTYEIENSDNSAYPKWNSKISANLTDDVSQKLDFVMDKLFNAPKSIEAQSMREAIKSTIEQNLSHQTKFEDPFGHQHFLIYSPENSALRTFEREAQIEPLGINGEGLYKLLKFTANTELEKIKTIKENLGLIGWFEDFDLPEGQFGNLEIVVKDKYIQNIESELYNHKNTNEGFLFLLFYILLLVSDKTPKFFAIDNIDASLNPKLCTELTKKIVQLAKEHDKQVILTTHNPAILDGIDLTDEEQKILVVSRNKKGHTKVRSVKAPNVPDGEIPVKLSEAFLNGMIGGLPKNF